MWRANALVNAGIPSALDVARSPRAAYAVLQQLDGTGGLAARLLLSAVLNATSLSLLSTGRLTLGLVLSLAACWSVVLSLQALAAAALVVGAGHRRRLSVRAAVSLLFVGHAPWSIWTLAIAAFAMVLPARLLDVVPALLLAIPFALWSVVIIVAFCREVLRLPRSEALLATAAHQAIVWGVSGVTLWWVSGGWARLPGLAGQ